MSVGAESVRIDRSNWSRSSQRSGGHYDERSTFYEGIARQCRACTKAFTFSAEEQKVAYEVRKKFVWWQPLLCPACRERLAVLKSLDRDFQSRWNSSKELVETDPKFLEGWLDITREMVHHGKPNWSLERMLLKRLNAS